MNTLARIGRWLVATNAGQLTAVLIIGLAIMRYDPQLIPRLIVGIITWAINFFAALLKANQASIEYIFCILLLFFAIRFMVRGVFRRDGGKK